MNRKVSGGSQNEKLFWTWHSWTGVYAVIFKMVQVGYTYGES